MNHKTLVLLGGNQFDTFSLFNQSMALMQEQVGSILKYSSIYESAPWGFSAEQNFLNQVIEIETQLAPLTQMKVLLEIEVLLGRKRKQPGIYKSRGIDLDILFIDDLILQTPELIVPHPRLHQRRFTLKPLCEHWSHLIHPILKRTLYELLMDCPDEGSVKRKS